MLNLSVLTQVYLSLVAREQGFRGREKTLKMSELLKKKLSVCSSASFPSTPSGNRKSPDAAKRRSSPSEPNPLYKSSKAFDTQFQAKDHLVVFTIERKFQKGLFGNAFYQIHSYKLTLKEKPEPYFNVNYRYFKITVNI
jgi:hypothetical protein